MPRLRVLGNPYTTQFDEIPPCMMQLWNELKVLFESIDVQTAISERSKSFKKAIEATPTENIRWAKYSILAARSEQNLKAILQLDGRGFCKKLCGSYHEMNIVLCFNNREAIGTNFLKLEVAAADSIRHRRTTTIAHENILGVLIQITDGLKSAGNWDASYATATEYTEAFKLAYEPLLHSKIVGFELHLT